MGSQAVVDCALYEDGRRLPGRVDLADVLKRIGEQPGRFVWIGLYEPTAEQFDEIAAAFELHPLAVEDAVRAHQRPKLERYGNTLFLVLKTIVYVAHDRVTATSEIVDTGEIMVFAGPGFAIVVRHGSAPALTGVRREMEAAPSCWAWVRSPSCTRWPTTWSTTTWRSPTPSSGTWRSWRPRCSRPSGRTTPAGSTNSSAS